MRVTVHGNYDDSVTHHDGTLSEIQESLLQSHPWLRSPNHEDDVDFHALLEQLADGTAYDVDVPPSGQKQVALVVATDSHGRLLLGKRRDGTGWTLPGGHVESKDSDPEAAARRELLEEAGLSPVSLTFQRQAPGEGCDLWIYSAMVRGVPHVRNDPDQECEKWQFVDVRGGIPSNIYDHLAGPEGDSNVVRQLFDLRRSEAVWLEDCGFADLRKGAYEEYIGRVKLPSKAEEHLLKTLKFKAAFRHPETGQVVPTGSFHDISQLPEQTAYQYQSGFVDEDGRFYDRSAAALAMHPQWAHRALDSADLAGDYRTTGDTFRGIGRGLGEKDLGKSEGQTLLAHPDPRERALAIKLADTTPNDVAAAILDPDPWCWRSAFNHPQATHALDVLAASHRDASGIPLYDRHDQLLKDPRCTPAHIRMMYRAVKDDHELPDDVRVQRLVALEAHPLGTHADIPIGGKLQKHWGHDEIYQATSPTYEKAKARPFAEQPMPHLGHLVEAYKKYVGGAEPLQPLDADLHHPGVASAKVVYKVPVAGHDEPRRLMVKPYAEHAAPLGGWAESTSQALYHAGGIGNLHQQSFVATHGKGGTTVPAVVIHIENAKPANHFSRDYPERDPHALAPDVASQARKIAAMDFLSNNFDRSSNNLMVKPSGDLLAIDHGLAFKYHLQPPAGAQKFRSFSEEAPAIFGGGNHDTYGDTFEWWRQNAPAIKKTFNDRIRMISDPRTVQELRQGFDERAKHLDRWAADHGAGQLQNDWARTWPKHQVKDINAGGLAGANGWK